ncbi:hypothetical protein [Candidatus Epulonipiscium viviparus]|uniref:hypothetical protein n=1 Tax=Candidatus Epulonipiscium viviparus TaxID=420336 RepID=UPI0027380F27|nr:hypothetical protein [Candidatus Epulopiscium viviparus]
MVAYYSVDAQPGKATRWESIDANEWNTTGGNVVATIADVAADATVDVAIFDLKNWYNLSSRASFVMPEKEAYNLSWAQGINEQIIAVRVADAYENAGSLEANLNVTATVDGTNAIAIIKDGAPVAGVTIKKDAADDAILTFDRAELGITDVTRPINIAANRAVTVSLTTADGDEISTIAQEISQLPAPEVAAVGDDVTVTLPSTLATALAESKMVAYYSVDAQPGKATRWESIDANEWNTTGGNVVATIADVAADATVDVAIFDLKNWYNLSSRASFVMPEKEAYNLSWAQGINEQIIAVRVADAYENAGSLEANLNVTATVDGSNAIAIIKDGAPVAGVTIKKDAADDAILTFDRAELGITDVTRPINIAANRAVTVSLATADGDEISTIAQEISQLPAPEVAAVGDDVTVTLPSTLATALAESKMVAYYSVNAQPGKATRWESIDANEWNTTAGNVVATIAGIAADTTVDVAIFDLKNWYNLSSRASFVMPEKEAYNLSWAQGIKRADYRSSGG